MRELIDAFSLMSFRQLVSVLYGLIRSKLVAALLGPFGMGIVSQGTGLMRLLQQFTALGIGSGFVKLASKYHSQGESERLNRTISMALITFGVLGVAVVFAAHLAADQVAEWVFGSSEYRWFVVIIALASLFFVEFNFILRIFQAMLLWRDYVRAAVTGYVLSMFVMAGLVLWGGILGAVLSIMATQAISLLVALWVLHRNVVEVENLHYWRFLPDKQAFQEVGRFVGPLTMVSVLPMGVAVAVRSLIINTLGANDNGLYQVVWGISITYMGLVLVSLNAFGVPKISSQLEDKAEIIKVQNHELRLGLFVVVPLTIVLSSFREWWIPILYSASFMDAGNILVWQFAADVIRVARQSITISLVPFERFGFILFDATIYWGGWLAGVWLLLPRLGLAAVPMVFFAVNALGLLIAFVYQRKSYKFHLTARNKVLAAKMALIAAIGLSSTHLIENIWVRMVVGAGVLGLMAWWVPTPHEYADLKALAKEHLRNFRPGEDESIE